MTNNPTPALEDAPLTAEQQYGLGCMADDLDAALHFTKTPVAPSMKIDALRAAITKARNALVGVVRASGDDPWGPDWPLWFGEAP